VEAASHSMVVIVVLSRSYSQRFWCMYELELARRNPRVLVIPIHFHPFPELVPDGGVAAYWASRDMAPECKHLVHPELWAENLHALDDQVQAYRRRTVSPDKNEEWQLAMRVVKRAVKQIPLPVDLQDEVVGFKDQEASLLAQLPGVDRPNRIQYLWLYGEGGKGKTTLAKVLFNGRLQERFTSRVFVSKGMQAARSKATSKPC